MLDCRAIVFDLDGTLVDSFAPLAAAVNAVRASLGMPPVTDDVVRSQVGRGVPALLAHHAAPERLPAALETFGVAYAKVLGKTRPLPGVPEVPLELKRRGIRLAIATNKPAVFGRPIVEAVGLGEAIGVVLGPDCGVPPKPSPEMIHRALELIGARAEEALYVGDMPLDVESARAAGVRPVLVATGAVSRVELDAVPGALVLDDLRALLPLIRTI